jgi:hypothetical protein
MLHAACSCRVSCADFVDLSPFLGHFDASKLKLRRIKFPLYLEGLMQMGCTI